MRLTLLKAKLHRVTVTHSELDYEGSCAIDEEWLTTSGIYDCEQIHIYNINNGERFITYAISAERGSGLISINGAAAHKASPGDQIIICAYSEMELSEVANFKPRLLYFDDNNCLTRVASSIPLQEA